MAGRADYGRVADAVLIHLQTTRCAALHKARFARKRWHMGGPWVRPLSAGMCKRQGELAASKITHRVVLVVEELVLLCQPQLHAHGSVTGRQADRRRACFVSKMQQHTRNSPAVAAA